MSWPYTWLWYFPSIQAERVTPTQDFAKQQEKLCSAAKWTDDLFTNLGGTGCPL